MRPIPYKLDLADSSIEFKQRSTFDIARDEFDVTSKDCATRFLRSAHNFKDVVRDADNNWDDGKTPNLKEWLY